MRLRKELRSDYLDSLTQRVRSKFDEIRALKKPAEEQQARFVSLPEMVADKTIALTHKQKLLLLSHELAKIAWDDYKATGRPITMGETMPVLKRTNLEFCAEFSAMDALRQAMGYYAEHGRLAQAFAELRGFSEEHWHTSISNNYEKYFRRQAEKTGVNLPADIAVHLAKAKDEEKQGRFKELERRLKIQEEYKKTGSKPD